MSNMIMERAEVAVEPVPNGEGLNEDVDPKVLKLTARPTTLYPPSPRAGTSKSFRQGSPVWADEDLDKISELPIENVQIPPPVEFDDTFVPIIPQPDLQQLEKGVRKRLKVECYIFFTLEIGAFALIVFLLWYFGHFE